MAAFSARVTGKTITITPYMDESDEPVLNYGCTFRENRLYGDIVYTSKTSCDATSISSITATNLKNGTKYFIAITVYNSNEEVINEVSLEVTTYGLNFETPGNVYSTGIKDVSVSYIDGMVSSTVPQNSSAASDIKWCIVTENNDIVGNIYSTGCDESGIAIISTDNILKPSTNYKLYVFINDIIFNGINDTAAILEFTTFDCAKNLALTTDSTEDMISATVSWETNRSSDYSLKVTCILFLNGVLKKTKIASTNGETLYFDNLESDSVYTISYIAADNEGNTTSNYITYATSGIVSQSTKIAIKPNDYFVPYIYHNGVWKKASIYLFSNGSWHLANPERY